MSSISIDPSTVTDDTSKDPNHDISKLTPEEVNQIDKLKQGLDPKNSNSILQFGVGAQKDISDFTSKVLETVKTKDAGVVGDILTELVTQVKSVDTNAFLNYKPNFLAGIPGVGVFFDELRKFRAKYESIEKNINNIVDKLDNQYDGMLKDIIMFDELYKQNLNYYKSLDLIIFAGEEKLTELQQMLSKKEDEYKISQDELALQEIEQIRNYIDQLDNRTHDLKLTRLSTIQSFPQINLIKSGDQGLAAKIQSAILNTIPLWKRHITIALGLYNQKAVIENLSKVDKTTDDLLKSNSVLLRSNTNEVAKTLQRGVISIETLETVQKNLIEGIEEARAIISDGKNQRIKASQKMVELQTELKDRLANIK